MEGKRILCHKLQSTLEERRRHKRLIEPAEPEVIAQMVDFGSNDTLSLATSGALTRAFLDQLRKNPNFIVGSASSRIVDGTTKYLRDLELHLARFHKAESALFFNSGYDANVAIWSTIPQPGDFVLYDEYVHASIHDGMRRGRATAVSFAHNDCDSFRRALEDLRDRHPAVADGRQVVFIALESFYSMDGDAAPIHEMLDIAKRTLPSGNAMFSVDEAHSNGLVGPNGSGFVCHYGLEKEIGLRLHTCGKALGSNGGVVLASPIIKQTLINYARNVIFSTAPSFVALAAVKAGYEIIASEDGDKRRQRLQQNIRHFHHKLTSHPQWATVKARAIIQLPTENIWNTGPFQSPIIPLVTPPGESIELAKHMHRAKFRANSVWYPVVPRKLDRVRVTVHADNTEEQIDAVVDVIMDWAMKRAEQSERSAKL